MLLSCVNPWLVPPQPENKSTRPHWRDGSSASTACSWASLPEYGTPEINQDPRTEPRTRFRSDFRLGAMAVVPRRDPLSPEKRSRLMSKVKTRDTAPELTLRKALWAGGVRGWRCHRRDLPGRPDLAFGRLRCAVFVDGAFWHGHPSKFRPGKSGDFW